MIEFEGYISGARFRRYLLGLVLVTYQLSFIPAFIVLLVVYEVSFALVNNLSFFYAMAFVFSLLLFLPFFRTKKEKQKITPYKVAVNHLYVRSTNSYGTTTKPISNVKWLIDYGSFYELRFKGLLQERFICQKDLLTKGSLKKFESLFDGKIKRKYGGQ